MKIWFTADTHWWHTNIIKGFSDWGFRRFKNVEEMNEILIERWNQRVGKNDIVMHLGDFSLCNVKMMRKILAKLNGKVIIVKGNHGDTKKLRRCGFSYVIVGSLRMKFIYKGKTYNVVIKHRPQTVRDVKFILCGHQHEKFKIRRTKKNIYINVGVDQWDYYPVSLKEVLNEIDKIDNE